ncbi:MAG: hypothetical protein K0S03_1720, partial [Burkholderiales bacterium]|nr:hypothetical protein [Burkholderiales bacterium]
MRILLACLLAAAAAPTSAQDAE